MLSDTTHVVDIPDETTTRDDELYFFFRDRQVPVKLSPSVSPLDAEIALDSEIFTSWVDRCEKEDGDKRIEIHSVLIQSLDDFGPRGVGFIKLLAESTLVCKQTNKIHVLPGACILRGTRAAVLVGIHCDDGSIHTPVVVRPSIPLGHVSALELPTGLVDDYNDGVNIIGKVFQKFEEEFGIQAKISDMTDLTSLASTTQEDEHHCYPGVSCSGFGSDEFLKVFYLEKQCTVKELERIRKKCQGMVDDTDLTSLQLVPMKEVWQKSQDAKALIAFFLLNQLRQQGKIPEQGKLATRIEPISLDATVHDDTTPSPTASELMVELYDGTKMPQLAFDMYRIPANKEGEQMVRAAVDAGYRHFDTAEHYRNEAMLGKALKSTGIPREEFFIVSKVWNDVQKSGRSGVRKRIETSLQTLGFGDYFDLVVVHWPVPRYFIETYKELELLKEEGMTKNIGISNFNIPDFENLMMPNSGVKILPAVSQMEVSPTLWRPNIVSFFQEKGCVVHATNACKPMEMESVINLAHKHNVTPAQIIHRWCLQKKLVIAVARTWEPHHMRENRAITHFSLSDDEIQMLDNLTDQNALRVQESRMLMRKVSM